MSPLDASFAGVYLHGAAADRLYEKIGAGFIASEVANMIPSVLKDHLAIK
jgi:NAD(P)H-hydrate repair Nnr-like enzyme with NAD(P)H-hydrate dehydratase domain